MWRRWWKDEQKNVTHTTPAVPVSPSRASSVNAQSVRCDLNSRGSLRRKINMSVNVLKIHVPMHEQVAKRDWKGNRTKSLRNSSSVKDSIGVLIAGWSSGNFRCIFSLSSPLRCEMMEISRVTFFARNEQNAYRIAQTGRREYYSRVWRKIMDKRCG